MRLPISLFFEILCFCFSIIFYLKKRNKLQLYFIPFLFITVLIELLGRWATFPDYFGKFAMYNIFTTLEFVFYSLLFFIHYKKQSFKKFSLLFIPTYIFSVVINLAFIQGFSKTFHTYTFLLGSFFIVIFCCFFFYESVQPDKIDQQLSKLPFFWICSGLLIYYLGSVIINALYQYLTSNDLRTEGMKIYDLINDSLIIILYSSFCIAFYLCPNNTKKFSSQS